MSRYLHFIDHPRRPGAFNHVAACGRLVGLLSTTPYIAEVTCQKCVLCACNRIPELQEARRP